MNTVNGAGTGCLSDLQLDALQLHVGADRPSLERHVEQCPACAERLRRQRLLDDAFLETVYPETVDRVVEQVIATDRTPRPAPLAAHRMRWAMGIAASLLLAAGLYGLSKKPASTATAPDPEYLADKGPAGLEVWCRRTDRVFRVQQGDKLYPEDMVRFVPRFRGATARYVMVVSIDGRGAISRYFPVSSDTAKRVSRSGSPLPGSTVLDDTPGPERILLLTSPEPFQFEAVRRALEAEWRSARSAAEVGPLDLDVDQTSLVFYKELE